MVAEELFVQGVRLFSQDADDDFNPGLSQSADPFTMDAWIRILDGANDSLDAGGSNGIGTWAGASGVATWLQSNV